MRKHTSLQIIRFSLMLSILLVLVHAAPAQIDPHFQRLYRQGIQDYQNKNYKEAAKRLELAVFGYTDEKVIAVGSAYISLCHFYLDDISKSRDHFRKAEAFVRAQGLEALELEDSVLLEFAQLWNRYLPSEAIALPQSQQKPDPHPPSAQELERRMYRLERQIKAVPDDIIAYYDLHEVYLLRQETKNAKKTIERMMDKNPQEIKGFYFIGMLEYHSREFKRAVKNFEKFLQKLPENSSEEELQRAAWAHLILSYNFKGDKARAFRLASDIAEYFTPEMIASIDLNPSEVVVLTEILQKVRKSN